MIKEIDNFFNKFISVLIILSLTIILSISIINIVGRWFSFSLLWIDPLVRHLVLFLTFLGGAQAISSNQHIKIDLLSRYLEKEEHHYFAKIIDLVLAATMLLGILILFYSSWNFLQVEIEFGKEEFFGLHTSVLVGILPLGFMILTIKQLLKVLELISIGRN